MEIAIALDAYDDLFSDFDIRGYRSRALSKDFLEELRVRLRRAGPRQGIELVFLLPGDRRVPADEGLIAQRLRSFFADRRAHYRGLDGRAKWRALAYVSIGIILSVAAASTVEYLSLHPLFSDFVLIPSWFFVWSGFENFIKSREEIGRKRRYYEALGQSRIAFAALEGYRESVIAP